MTFQVAESAVPTTILTITVILTDTLTVGDNAISQTARYDLLVLDQFGRRFVFPGDSGDLVPHLTASEISSLQGFMNTLRARAEDQVLGT